MEEYNKFKKIRLIKLSNEIKEYETELLKIDPTIKEFNNILNKIIIIKKEIDILKKLTYEEYLKNKKKYSDYINKYDFITNLDDLQIKEFIYAINLNEKLKQFNITQEIIIPDSLKALNNNFIMNNINTSKITDINELSYMLNYTEKEYTNLINKYNKLLEIIDSLNIAQLSILKTNNSSNNISTKNNLESLRMFGEDKIIDLIETELKQLDIEEKKLIKTELVKNKIVKIKNKIQEHTEYLLKNILNYIKFVLKDYEEFITFEEIDNINIRNIIFKMTAKVNILKNDYEKLIKDIKGKKLIKETFTKSEIKHKNNIENITKKLSLGYNFKIEDLDKINENKILEIIAKNKVYDMLLNKSFDNDLKLK